MYIEAPVLIGIIWKPDGTGYSVIENSIPSFAFLFYTVKFAVLGIALVYIIRHCYLHCTLKEEEKTENSLMM
jgi:hypothetical protein